MDDTGALTVTTFTLHGPIVGIGTVSCVMNCGPVSRR
ncbi:hypothetical protein QFZ75_008122 [Streptomyces sp. V3I8]|nr:hypothetical protein [Streptomyces sp. V3I8]